ncbi:beta-glucan synthesis-associated protein-domain-containing protein [Mycena epipterygia]|nr:beta-glucan synthesis-associated protein-domain-containing protein [Mycena epipterygia]
MSLSSHASRKGYKRENSPNLLPTPDDWESVPSSPRSGISDKFSLSPDPALWGSNLSPNLVEADDILHNPEFKGGKLVDRPSSGIITRRGIANLGCLGILTLGLVALFAGYPVITFVQKTLLGTGTFGVSVNATGQVAAIGNYGLIDLDTPSDAYTITSLYSGKQMKLVFSDEFNTDGRTFYPGDDPYFEAVDLHYWGTGNLEWYDPAGVTTGNGSLKITLTKKPTHDLDYQGGLVTSWNKFCFTGGLVVTSATLPGNNNIHGLWPAVWTMGNLGRAGFGASLDGIPTPTTHATLAPLQIRRLTVSRRSQQLAALTTNPIEGSSRTLMDRDFPAALVQASPTRARSTLQMVRMSADPPRRSTCSRRRSRMGLGGEFRSRVNGRPSMRATCGPIRATLSS